MQIASLGGRPLAAGESGEVVIRGGLVMLGYLNRPDLTEQTIIDGWLRTGDIGAIDDRGYLFLKGRIGDVIISGGFNVYPADVEATLATHPAVREAIVVGRSDDYWGQRVEVAVVLASGEEVSSEALVDSAKSRLGSVRAPKAVHVVPQLPINAVDKIARRDVLLAIKEMERRASV